MWFTEVRIQEITHYSYDLVVKNSFILLFNSIVTVAVVSVVVVSNVIVLVV